MTNLLFPAVAPSEHPTITAGRFPHVQKRSTGGRSGRIRLANVQLDGEIQLAFTNVDTPLLLQLYSHWAQTRGRTYDFALPAVLFQSMEASTKARLMATAWRFKEQPKVVDICGGVPDRLLHTVEITLRSQPRRVLSPVLQDAPDLSLPVVPKTAPGARFAVTTTWTGGAAGINTINAPGAALAIRVAFVGGSASAIGSANAPGAAWSVTTAWESVGRTTPQAAWNATVAFAGGKASIQGLAPGASLNATASFTGGAASVPPQAAGGAALNVSAAWSGGAGNITGGTAPGATLNVTTAWVGGAAQSIGPGATLNVTAVWVGGAGSLGGTAPGADWNTTASWAGGAASNADPSFSSVELLLNFVAADGTTTFTDSSVNGFTITRYGDAVISGNALSLDGSGDYIATPFSSELSIGTGNFTIETFVEPTDTKDMNVFYSNFNTSSAVEAGSIGVSIFSSKWLIDVPGVTSGSSAQSVAINTRVHVALTRLNGDLRLWVAGQSAVSFGFSLNNSFNATRLTIGANRVSSPFAEFKGKIGPFRFTRGLARYTATFTPPTGTFPTS